MRTSLPTTWMRDVPGMAVGVDTRGKVYVQLPKELVWDRRYATIAVREDRAKGCVDVHITHGSPYRGAKPGFHAWQQEVSAGGQEPATRQLAVSRANLVAGSAALIERLTDPCRDVGALIRITPDGFTIRLCPASGTVGMLRYSKAVERDAVRMMANHSAHARLVARTHEEKSAQLALGYGGGHPNCSSVIYHTMPSPAPWARPMHSDWFPVGGPGSDWMGKWPDTTNWLSEPGFINQALFNMETEDMKSIDNTTSDALPFGLIAGEKIVQCEFSDGASKGYAYFAGELDVKEGDYVVVASPHNPSGYTGGGIHDVECGGYLTVVRVTSVDPNAEGIRKAAKWIISKVDVTEYVARRQRVEQLKTLDQAIRAAEAQARKQLEMEKLRELSPELAALIDQRNALVGIDTTKKES